MITFSTFMEIINMAPEVRTHGYVNKKGLKEQGDFTDLTYDNFYEYAQYIGYEGVRPKTPDDILEIAKQIGF